MTAVSDRVLESILFERRHLNDSAGGVWSKRLRLLGNVCRDRWKYRDVHERSFLLELARFPLGYLFDRNPRL